MPARYFRSEASSLELEPTDVARRQRRKRLEM